LIPFLLQDAFLPTMPEDYLLEAKRIILGASGGAFYGIKTLCTGQ